MGRSVLDPGSRTQHPPVHPVGFLQLPVSNEREGENLFIGVAFQQGYIFSALENYFFYFKANLTCQPLRFFCLAGFLASLFCLFLLSYFPAADIFRTEWLPSINSRVQKPEKKITPSFSDMQLTLTFTKIRSQCWDMGDCWRGFGSCVTKWMVCPDVAFTHTHRPTPKHIHAHNSMDLRAGISLQKLSAV